MYPLKDLLPSSECCSNKVLKIQIDLLDNTLTCYPQKFIPFILESKTPKSQYGYNICTAFIKLSEQQLKELMYQYNVNMSEPNKNIKVKFYENNLYNFYILPGYLLNNTSEVINAVEQFLSNENNWLFTTNRLYIYMETNP